MVAKSLLFKNIYNIPWIKPFLGIYSIPNRSVEFRVVRSSEELNHLHIQEHLKNKHKKVIYIY